MKNLSKTIAILALTIFSLNSYANTGVSKKKLRKIENQASKALDQMNYKKALALYEELDKLTSNSSFDYELGILHLTFEHNAKALRYLISANANGERSIVLNYYLGHAHLRHDNFEKAKKHFDNYKTDIKKEYPGVRFIVPSDYPSEAKVNLTKSLADVDKTLAEYQESRQPKNTRVTLNID